MNPHRLVYMNPQTCGCDMHNYAVTLQNMEREKKVEFTWVSLIAAVMRLQCKKLVLKTIKGKKTTNYYASNL